ncbi:SIP domain-containing protein [Aeromicrobium sp. CTD01-1L150]|uniref:SIP domain-containing protein n=1 Tax=Aeromicrobium sp. CTD01-1L150 TaxID=3341830 RepID=UPI0035BF9D08
MSIRSLRTHPLVLRRLVVERTQSITPRLVRVGFTGDQLGEFEAAGRLQPAFASPAFDDHVKLIFAGEGPIEQALPVQLPHGIEWTRSEHRVTRDYTPRRVEPGLLEMDFVLGHDGPASDFAVSAEPGDETWIVGPKSSTVVPDDLDWIVLVGDETALPAIARFLQERPTAAPAHVYVLHASPDARIDLPVREQDTLVWVEAACDDEQAPLRVVSEHPWTDGMGYVWGAGESKAFLAVRRFLRRERGMAADRVNVTGYWHHRPATGSDAERPDLAANLGSAAVSWFAVRGALRSGVLDALADADPLTTHGLTSAAGVEPQLLGPLLAVLVDAGLVRTDRDVITLTDQGRALVDDDHEREHLEGFDADLLLSLAHLDRALVSGTSPWEQARGESLLTSSHSDPQVREELVEHAETLGFVLDALLELPVWAGAEPVGLCGPAAMTIAHTARERGAVAPFVVADDPGLLATLGESGAVTDTELTDDLGRCAVVVSGLALGHRSDVEAQQLLEQLANHTDELVLVESFRRDALGAKPATRSLLEAAMSGTAARDADRVSELAARAGWTRRNLLPLGWGFEALVLGSG